MLLFNERSQLDLYSRMHLIMHEQVWPHDLSGEFGWF
jgi:hypothetical protein